VPRAGGVREEEVVRAWPALDVDILAQLNGSFGADDDQAPVAPGRHALRREPVDTDIARGALAAQDNLAEILEPRARQLAEPRHRAADDLRVAAAREHQELVDLVRPEVTEDPAMRRVVEEPRGADRGVQPVRREVHGLRHRPDLAGGHQLQRNLD
jgi:hypothetical protein